MNRGSDEQASEPVRSETDRSLRSFEKAGWVSACTFVLVLVLMWANHPVLLRRHPDRVLAQCGIAALIAFIMIWFVDSNKKPGS
jgi:p-aminobenzoyl-glutamate transporter AbgT